MCLFRIVILNGNYILVVYGWMWILKWSPKGRVLKRDWTACLEFVNHSRCNNEHDLRGGLYVINDSENHVHLDNEMKLT